MNPTRRILYFCPDMALPSGGIKVLYRHVWQLRKLGFNAFIVHTASGFSVKWHGFDAPVICLQDRPKLSSEDVMVFPEGLNDYLKQACRIGATRVMLALSWESIYKSMPAGEDWRDYGVSHVITPSPVIKRFVEWTMRIPVTVIDDYIDTARFAHQPERKQDKIAYMSRKSPMGDWLHAIFTKNGSRAAGYAWARLHDLAEDAYAGQLAEARLYLALTSREGANISVLEAMSSGCLVIGFGGVGGLAYMTGAGPGQNCVLVENEDFLALGCAVEEAVERLAADPNAYRDVIANGIATAARFGDLGNEAACLRAYFSRLAGDPPG